LLRLLVVPFPPYRYAYPSVVMVTHDAQAASYGDRMVHIKDGRVDAEEPVRGRQNALRLHHP
jgi:ABC-type lipoprotein export system ATPase subunit